MRDALQGVARVGRDGDPCKRIKFADCKELVDKDLQAKNNAKLLKFVADFKAKPTVKPVAAFAPKQAPAKYSYSKTSSRQVQVPASQGKLFFKPSAALPGNRQTLNHQVPPRKEEL